MSNHSPGAVLRIASAAAAVGLWFAAAATASAQVPAPAPPGPLSKAHSPLEGSANCQKCHRPVSGVDSAKCLACHKPIADRIAGKRGVHREVTGQCEGCHVEHGGVDVDLRPLDIAQFNHAEETGFALAGRHQALAKTCASCHKTRSFLTNNPACVSCHQDGHKGALGTACSTCHTPTAWRSASRAFHKTTLFPLEGRHLTVACASCHLNGVTKGTPTKCFDCHWIRRRDDPYETRLGSQCEMCHRPISWTAVNWNHAARTGFALNASHRPLTCGACHKDRRFTGTGFTCCELPSQGLQPDAPAEPPGRRIPARRAKRAIAPGIRPGPRRCSAISPTRSSASTRPRTAHVVTRTASTRARRATVSAATWPTTRGRPTRITRRQVSRRRATGATGRATRVGGGAASTTPPSLWSASTRRSRARPVTRTASTRARRASASAATWRPTRRRRVRITRRPDSPRRATRATGRRTRRGSRAGSRTRRFRLRPAATPGSRARRATRRRTTTRSSRASPDATLGPPPNRTTVR